MTHKRIFQAWQNWIAPTLVIAVPILIFFMCSGCTATTAIASEKVETKAKTRLAVIEKNLDAIMESSKDWKAFKKAAEELQKADKKVVATKQWKARKKAHDTLQKAAKKLSNTKLWQQYNILRKEERVIKGLLE